MHLLIFRRGRQFNYYQHDLSVQSHMALNGNPVIPPGGMRRPVETHCVRLNTDFHRITSTASCSPR